MKIGIFIKKNWKQIVAIFLLLYFLLCMGGVSF